MGCSLLSLHRSPRRDLPAGCRVPTRLRQKVEAGDGPPTLLGSLNDVVQPATQTCDLGRQGGSTKAAPQLQSRWHKARRAASGPGRGRAEASWLSGCSPCCAHPRQATTPDDDANAPTLLPHPSTSTPTTPPSPTTGTSPSLGVYKVWDGVAGVQGVALLGGPHSVVGALQGAWWGVRAGGGGTMVLG